LFSGREGGLRNKLKQRVEEEWREHEQHHASHHQYGHHGTTPDPRSGVSCQMTRSKAKWSNGDALEVCFPHITPFRVHFAEKLQEIYSKRVLRDHSQQRTLRLH
jgi:hypothetical protein